MSEDLQIDFFRTTGRPTLPLTAEVVGEISAVDLELLGNSKGYEIPAIKRLSDRHHALARAIVAGASMGEAALICGYDISRISILKNDPAFRELLAFYGEEKVRAFRDTQAKLAGIASDALDELQTRLEDAPDKIPLDKLMQLVSLGADRSGNGPSSTQNVNMNSGVADRLSAARERVAARRAGKVIDVESPTNVIPLGKEPPHGE